ncbi:MAG: hypothetical protein ACKO3P_03965 [Planctomycetaceae bacterium]
MSRCGKCPSFDMTGCGDMLSTLLFVGKRVNGERRREPVDE